VSDNTPEDHAVNDVAVEGSSSVARARSEPASLVRMVNQIAANVAHHPQEQAVAEIVTHLQATWAPSMRADLVSYLEGGGLELTPLAAAATEQLRTAGSKH